jgi:hypothetical protein
VYIFYQNHPAYKDAHDVNDITKGEEHVIIDEWGNEILPPHFPYYIP